MTKERITHNLTKIRDQLAALQEKKNELEGQLRIVEDAEKMKFIEKNKISMDQLIMLNKLSEEELLALLKKKEQEQEKQVTEKEETCNEKIEATL